MSAWHIIGRGKNGWHAEGINVRSSGGDIEDRPWWKGGVQKGYLSEAIEGALVYDADGADYGAFAELVISGPMCDPALPPEGVERLSPRQRETAAFMAPALGGEFQALACMAQDERYSGLDSVGVAIYRRLLQAIPGIKLGTVRSGAVVWEECS